MLRLDAVGFRHTGSDIQFNYSLQANRGEIIGVMGESGSGKSTLLDLIAGFQRASSGVISWDGQRIDHLPPEQRPVTMIFQQHNLFEHLSAEKNVAVGLNNGASVSDLQYQLVLKTLEKVGLSGFHQRRVSNLSGGQQQRVAIARAVVREHPVLLLDEPFRGLDDDTRFEILALLRLIADEEGRCVLMITHDNSDCEAIADRVLRVINGALVSE